MAERTSLITCFRMSLMAVVVSAGRDFRDFATLLALLPLSGFSSWPWSNDLLRFRDALGCSFAELVSSVTGDVAVELACEEERLCLADLGAGRLRFAFASSGDASLFFLGLPFGPGAERTEVVSGSGLGVGECATGDAGADERLDDEEAGDIWGQGWVGCTTCHQREMSIEAVSCCDVQRRCLLQNADIPNSPSLSHGHLPHSA